MLDVIAAFCAAALAALGVGGGGLLVIYLALILNMEQHAAQGINLLFFIVASLASLPLHFLKKRVKVRPALIFSFFGIFGAWLGCVLSAKTSQGTVRFFFGLMLIAAGSITLFKAFKGSKTKLAK